MKALVVGGDLRMELAGRLLQAEGWQTGRICSGQGSGWQTKVRQADVILLPYPHAVKDDCIPGWKGGGVGEVLAQASPGVCVLAGGGLGDGVHRTADGQMIRLLRYTDSAAFSARNAEISGEAAVCELMRRSRRMLDEQQLLVLGYGLFAKAICWRLRALGTKVWVAARREQQRRQARSDGLQAVAMEEIPRIAPCMDAVLNTVPAVLIGRDQLQCFPEHTVFLELASPPYGIDLPAAAELEKDVAVLPGLPSQYAPLSAAKALAAAVRELVKEERV